MTMPTSPSLTGTVLGGKYRLGREIGRGGMGSVYEAVQENLQRRVALKVLLPELADEMEVLARFRREAELAASLRHPNIVAVTDFEHRQGEPPFLVMELLVGESLRTRLSRVGPDDPNVTVSITMQVLSALAAAHAAGVVHRDLKPDNVFLVEVSGMGSLAKLLDFGVAKLTEGAGYKRLTSTGVLIGTPSYMAPEQLSGQSLDGRTDLYALGVMMYRALAGRLPFRGKTPGDLLKEVFVGTPEPLARIRPDLSPALIGIVDKAMARLPVARFASANEMRDALSYVGRASMLPMEPRNSFVPAQPSTSYPPNATTSSPPRLSPDPNATVVGRPSGAPRVSIPAESRMSPAPNVQSSFVQPNPWPPAQPPIGAPFARPTQSKPPIPRNLILGIGGAAALAIVGTTVILVVQAREPDASAASAVGASPVGTASRPMSMIGMVVPASVLGPMRMDVSSVYSNVFSSTATLDPGIRQFATQTLSCLEQANVILPNATTVGLAVNIDSSGHATNPTIDDPVQRTETFDCLSRNIQMVQFPQPSAGVPGGLSMQIQFLSGTYGNANAP